MRMKLTKPDSKRRNWIDRLEGRDNSSLSLLLKIDGKVIAIASRKQVIAGNLRELAPILSINT